MVRRSPKFPGNFSWIVRGLAIAAAGIVLYGCKTTAGSMSAAEALQTARHFGHANFVAPQRTIADVREILGEPRPLPDSCVEERSLMQDRLEIAWGLAREGFLGEMDTDNRFAASDIAWHRGHYKTVERLLTVRANAIPDEIAYTRWKQGVAYAKLALVRATLGNTGGARSALRSASAAWLNSGRYGWADTPREQAGSIARAEAAIAQFEGKLSDAETLFREAIEELPYIDPQLLVDLAENLFFQGRLIEADAQFREALLPLIRWQHNAYGAGSGRGVVTFARILADQGKIDDARYVAEIAVNMYEIDCVPEDSVTYAYARQVLASILTIQGEWTKALDVFQTVERDFAGKREDFERIAGANPDWPLVLARAGRLDDARARLKVARAAARERHGEKSWQRANLEGVGAVIEATAGNTSAALQGFRGTLARFIELRSEHTWDGAAGIGQGRQRVILVSYLDLLADLIGAERAPDVRAQYVAEMFALSDQLRGVLVQSAVTAAGARASGGNSDQAALIRQVQDLTRQFRTSVDILQTLEIAPADQRNQQVVVELRAKVKKLRQARRVLTADIGTRFPEYASLVNPKAPTVSDVQAALRPGEAMISTFSGDSHTYVWAVPKSGAVSFRAVPIGRKDLTTQIDRLRRALDAENMAGLNDIATFDSAAAYQLYLQLLDPVADGWRSAKHLLVIPDGPLGYLPLSVLPTAPVQSGGDGGLLFDSYRSVLWLARSHAVSVVPSGAAFMALRRARASGTKRKPFVGFGDPYFSPVQAAKAETTAKAVTQVATAPTETVSRSFRSTPKIRAESSADLALLPRLPGTGDEILAVAQALGADPEEDVFTGRRATEGQVKSMNLSRYRIISFATHGLVPGDLNGLIQPALAFTSPRVAGGEDDGLLTMGEILGLKLDADWVVLSACNTAAGAGAGAEAVSGLGRAFFYAGTKSLLASNWAVHSDATKTLMIDLFRRQAAEKTMLPAEALRLAMVNLIDREGFRRNRGGKQVFSYAHPIFWAPFSLVGEGGHIRRKAGKSS